MDAEEATVPFVADAECSLVRVAEKEEVGWSEKAASGARARLPRSDMEEEEANFGPASEAKQIGV